MPFTEFYCNFSTGSNLNGGSDAGSASYTATNGNWNATTGVFTPTSGDPSASVAVGQFASVYIDGATVGVFIGRVTAVNATTITISTTIMFGTAPTTNATGRSIKVGGAWKGPNGASGFPFNIASGIAVNASGDRMRINLSNAATYDITASITVNASAATAWVTQGYSLTPGDGGKAIIDGGTSGASYNLYLNSVTSFLIADLIFQNNGATGSADGIVIASRSHASRCVVRNVRGSGFACQGNQLIQECEAYGCNQSNTATFSGFQMNSSSGAILIRCISHDNAGSNSHGFYCASAGVYMFGCISESNGGSGLLIDSTGTTTNAVIHGCDFYNNGAAGITIPNTSLFTCLIENCNFVKNVGWGINGSGASMRRGIVTNCGFGSGTQANGSGTTTGLKGIVESASVTYSADVTPWVDPANGNFRINLLAAIRAGRGVFTQTQAGYAGTVGNPDIGAGGHVGVVLQ